MRSVVLSKLEPRHVKTNKVTCVPSETQISLGVSRVWPESTLCTSRGLNFLHADNKDSGQTGWISGLI